MAEAMRVLVVAPTSMPTVEMTALLPLRALNSQDIQWRYRPSWRIRSSDLEWCDIVWAVRAFDDKSLAALVSAKRMKIPILLDVDDDLQILPYPSALAATYHSIHAQLNIELAYACASLVRTHSQVLSERLGDRGLRTKFVKFWQFAPPISGFARKCNSGDSINVIFPSVRPLVSQVERMCVEALASFAERVPRLSFTTFADSPLLETLRSRGVSVVIARPIQGYESYLSYLTGNGFDIGVAPQIETPFSSCKVDAKFRDFSYAGIAGIYSNVRPFSDSVQPGIDGLLVDASVDAWLMALDVLADREERVAIADSARERLLKEYSLDAFTHAVVADLGSVACASQRGMIAHAPSRALGIWALGPESYRFMSSFPSPHVVIASDPISISSGVCGVPLALCTDAPALEKREELLREGTETVMVHPPQCNCSHGATNRRSAVSHGLWEGVPRFRATQAVWSRAVADACDIEVVPNLKAPRQRSWTQLRSKLKMMAADLEWMQAARKSRGTTDDHG